jgi:peptidoglycan/LPS O-acetylase OafA/YrhL
MLIFNSGWFLVQTIITYTAGIKLFAYLRFDQNVASPGATIATLIVCLIAVIGSAEIFHRLVDQPSQKLAHLAFEWFTK